MWSMARREQNVSVFLFGPQPSHAGGFSPLLPGPFYLSHAIYGIKRFVKQPIQGKDRPLQGKRKRCEERERSTRRTTDRSCLSLEGEEQLLGKKF